MIFGFLLPFFLLVVALLQSRPSTDPTVHSKTDLCLSTYLIGVMFESHELQEHAQLCYLISPDRLDLLEATIVPHS